MVRIEKNKKDWDNTLRKVFPKGIPNSCEWTKIEDIVSILNTIGSIDDTNYIFLPSGGVTDIKSAKLSSEIGCIEVYTGTVNILKPKRLTFESFSNSLWRYFRIETNELPASGVYENNDASFEEVVEVKQGRYIQLQYWDFDDFEGEKFPDTARPLTRHFEGSFLIFAQSSYFNRIHHISDPISNKMNEDEFRNFIKTLNDKYQ